ncbi:MAG: 3'-5' exoribonuclease [Candidatus Omnitrophica bacterium]|nr:3'-5' exoribonuclease [Candidatus Omnitrophota bacterium]
MAEVYVSTDVETNGPIPGVYSMLSFGSAAFNLDKEIISTFSVNLETLPGAIEDKETMQWWARHKQAWSAARKDLQDPEKAMQDYLLWLKKLCGRPVFVGYPASFDFMFISWYLYKFTGENPFSYLALDIKTFAWAFLDKPFLEVTKSSMPKDWFDECKKTHIALDDATEQGLLFCNMVAKIK